ncbi:Methionine ABC transporter ATP-binding protein [Labilithrix luteola]|uniref:Methionine ABC transporter ATP-binding protein n=1 Tax=Labilithrix luteola TaxID=1391654 RepID=A0A0K1PRJ3_9BACT|nr:ATP-binding cassette domain-containing protein [Labilithrix luteola]AKU96147.1 Methionine ABC transporter ATP-binding protein [Labilithrix luteola]
MASSCLVVAELSVVRGDRTIVDHASLSLEVGTIATIQGASGSGKSTFLRAIARLIAVDGGRISFEGHDALAMEVTEYRRRVAYVPQLPRMFEGTVADNVRAGPRFQGVSLSDGAVAELLERVGLAAEMARRPASELSGGEKLRVGLARALANDPRVLLLDESTSALDPESAARVIDRVVSLTRTGTAAICVTHIDEHARRFGGARYHMTSGVLAEGA